MVAFMRFYRRSEIETLPQNSSSNLPSTTETNNPIKPVDPASGTPPRTIINDLGSQAIYLINILTNQGPFDLTKNKFNNFISFKM